MVEGTGQDALFMSLAMAKEKQAWVLFVFGEKRPYSQRVVHGACDNDMRIYRMCADIVDLATVADQGSYQPLFHDMENGDISRRTGDAQYWHIIHICPATAVE